VSGVRVKVKKKNNIGLRLVSKSNLFQWFVIYSLSTVLAVISVLIYLTEMIG